MTRKNSKWDWNAKCDEAFEKSKSLLSEKSLLSLFNPKLPIVVTCDSSSYGVGAVLNNIVDGIERPVIFASTTLSQAEKAYCQLEKEA